MILYQATILLNPKTKKNNQDIKFKPTGNKGFYKKTPYGYKYVGVPFISQSNQYKKYESDVGWFLRKPPMPISEPCNIKCIFYRDSDRRVDLTNLLEAIDDILVKYKIISDDNFHVIASHDGSRVYVDRKNPRTEIVIEDAYEI